MCGCGAAALCRAGNGTVAAFVESGSGQRVPVLVNNVFIGQVWRAAAAALAAGCAAGGLLMRVARAPSTLLLLLLVAGCRPRHPGCAGPSWRRRCQVGGRSEQQQG